LAKKHDIKMIAQWARENGIKGYEHLDPQEQQKHRFNEQKRQRAKSDWKGKSSKHANS